MDKSENEIHAILVIPHTERFYDYYLNGEADKRTMLRDELNKFCNELCISCASEINKCIFEMRPFVLYPQSAEFSELKENPPPKLNHRKLLFPTVIEVEKKKGTCIEAKQKYRRGYHQRLFYMAAIWHSH